MREDQDPALVDQTRPSIARCYDAMLDGKDNFAVDREAIGKFLAVCPPGKEMAIENRKWLSRAIRWLTDKAGIDQFLDCGSGLPTQENTHEIAQRVNPDAVVVYVDNDPICNAHGRALLEENEHTFFVNADLATPEQLFANPEITGKLDLTRPLALIQCSTIHHVPDIADPYGIMQRYINALPSSSYVALTHFLDPEEPRLTQMVRDLERVMQEETVGSGWWRTRATIESYFDGLELVPPGVVKLHEWWPRGPRLKELSDANELVVGGVGRKP